MASSCGIYAPRCRPSGRDVLLDPVPTSWWSSGLGLLHLLLGELGLLGVAQQLGDGGLDVLGGLAGGLPLVAEQFSAGLDWALPAVFDMISHSSTRV